MVTQSYLDFLFGLYSDGISLPQDQIDLLRQNGRIKEERKPIPKAPKDQQTLSMPSIKTDEESAVDDDIVISLTPNIMSSEDISVFDPQNHVHKKFLSVGSVTSDMWKPESIVYHKEDFVNWIDSFIFHGFQNMIVYEKFELYKKQAYDWLLENDVLSNYVYPEDIAEFKQRELDRCNENSLYALNKYGKVKDAVVSGGWRTYIATPCHEVMIYLDDCTYSLLIGKPRQIAATSTIGLLAAKSIIFNKNFFIKFITEDKDKGLEIYNDKIRASFTAFPDWMVPDVLNWSGTHLRLGNKGERKGKDDGVGSSILVDAPSITAIAGGSPNKALVDEAGNIGIFSKMMHDARPTMFSVNPVTGKITMNRQFIGWGTGGDMERGGKSFEFEFMAAVEAWKKRIFGSGIIPIFFDWTTRPGMTQEFYDQQKEEAFSKTGPDAASSKIKFYQQFPATIEDMFLSSQKTLIDIEYIARQEKKIDSLPQPAKEQYGFFEPVYDETKPMPEGFDIPYYIKDVEFIQCDELDPRVTTIIFQHPKKEWADRYYSGTDPIASDSGLSNMAKAIWDAEYNTVSAVTDHRDQNYKYTYMQCMCLGIYYDVNNKKGIKDLLECNIGAAYRDYMEARGRFHCMVHTSELPIQFQTKTGGQIIGIDNKGVRNKLIIDKIFELIQAYGDRIYIRRMWTQLKTFVCQVTEKGGETWGPINRKFYKDDILWAIVYSYICRLCYSHIKPKKTTGESESIGVYYPLYRDKNYKLRRQAVKIKR